MTIPASVVPAPDERGDLLVRQRRAKMARSAHAFVRGATAKFYEWLDEAGGRLPEGPQVWICGDCHTGNLGPLASDDGRVAVQIRDLDQTVIGNPAHDLIRLGLSLASAARGADLPGIVTARMVEALVEGYAAGLLGEADEEGERPRIVRDLLARSSKRKWRHLAAERIEDVEPVLPIGRTFWPLAREELAGLDDLFRTDAIRDMVQRLFGEEEAGQPEILDAAYWVKGCSSLGRRRYAVLVGVAEGQPRHGRMRLIDVKEAGAAAAPRAGSVKAPRDHAERVVAGARALSPHLGDRMRAGRLLETSVVLRELMPQDLKIEVGKLDRAGAAATARYLALVVGLAHGRQMDGAARRRWSAEVTRSRSKTLGAPSWLWGSVVELVASHEAAYLDHCRRYAPPEDEAD